MSLTKVGKPSIEQANEIGRAQPASVLKAGEMQTQRVEGVRCPTSEVAGDGVDGLHEVIDLAGGVGSGLQSEVAGVDQRTVEGVKSGLKYVGWRSSHKEDARVPPNASKLSDRGWRGQTQPRGRACRQPLFAGARGKVLG